MTFASKKLAFELRYQSQHFSELQHELTSKSTTT